MTWLEFFAAIIGALAWPVALLLVVLTFENPIRELIKNIKRVSWNGMSVEIAGRNLEGHLQMAEAEGLAGRIDRGINAVERFGSLAADYPRETILQAWHMLDNDLREASVDIYPR